MWFKDCVFPKLAATVKPIPVISPGRVARIQNIPFPLKEKNINLIDLLFSSCKD